MADLSGLPVEILQKIIKEVLFSPYPTVISRSGGFGGIPSTNEFVIPINTIRYQPHIYVHYQIFL